MILFGLIMLLMIIYVVKIHGQDIMDLFGLLQRGNETEITEYLHRRGQLSGMFSVFLISIMQVLSIFFPGIAIQLSAGMIFGWRRGFIVTYAGFLSGNMIAFLLSRRVGNRISEYIPERDNSWLISHINNANSAFIIALASLVPVVPNGIIPYIASSADISNQRFLYSVAVTSWIHILCNSIAGYFLLRHDFLFMTIAMGIQLVIIAAVAAHRDQIVDVLSRNASKADRH